MISVDFQRMTYAQDLTIVIRLAFGLGLEFSVALHSGLVVGFSSLKLGEHGIFAMEIVSTVAHTSFRSSGFTCHHHVKKHESRISQHPEARHAATML